MDELPTGRTQKTKMSNKHLQKESEERKWEQHVASSRADDVEDPVCPIFTSSAGCHRFASCRSHRWLPCILAQHAASDPGCWRALVVNMLLPCTKTGAAEPFCGGHGTSSGCQAVSGSAVWLSACAASTLLDSPIIVMEKPQLQCHSSKTRQPHQTRPLTACWRAVRVRNKHLLGRLELQNK